MNEPFIDEEIKILKLYQTLSPSRKYLSKRLAVEFVPPLWFLAMWLCGYVAMWLCGYVAMWLCGYIGLFPVPE